MEIIRNIAGNTEFKIANTKLYAPISYFVNWRQCIINQTINWKKKDQLHEGFKRYVYWNQYKTKIKSRDLDNVNPLRILLDASFQGVKKLFVLAFNNTTVDVANNPINTTNNSWKSSHRKHFIPRADITNFNVLTDSRNFYEQPIGDQIKKYDGIRKIASGQGDDYTTGCLLDYQYFKDHYQLITVDLSKKEN